MRDLSEAKHDPANHLLSETDAEIEAEAVNTPNGMRVMVTIRTSSATVTIFLRKGNAIAYAAKLNSCAGSIAGRSALEAMQEG